jgi:hypothetical protein
LHIEVPEEIFESASRLAPSDTFRQTGNLGAIFGFDRRISIQKGASHRDPNANLVYPGVPWGVVRGFGAVGRLIAKSITGPEAAFVLPSGSKRSTFPTTPRKYRIKFIFDILDTRHEGIYGVLEYRASHSETGSVRVAIAVQTNLSTSRRNMLLTNLSRLREIFDYIFVVENQLLSFRKSAAPQLTLSGRATKYVRACIDGILKIAWASDGPRSREDFLKTFPTNGFCLVGRALGPKNNNLVRTALTTMLNEYLDRGSGDGLLQ